MQVSLYRPDPKKHVLRMRACATGDGGVVGDVMEDIRPGDNFLGWTYAELLALGNGMHDIQPKFRPRLWPGEN